MSMIKRFVLLAQLFYISILFSSAPILIPMTDTSTYDFIEYLQTSGKIDVAFSGSKPYRSDYIYSELKNIKTPSNLIESFTKRFKEKYVSNDDKFGKIESENTSAWFDIYLNQYHIIQESTRKIWADIDQPITDGGIKAKIEYKDFLSIYTDSGVMIKHSLTNKLRDEFETLVLTPSGGGEGFQSEDHTETTLLLSGDGVHLAIGKHPVSLGQGKMNSLTLSQLDAYYENILFELKGDRIKFTTITGFLLPDEQTLSESYIPEYIYYNGTVWDKSDSYSKREKYLSAHRLEWRATDNLNFGINEMVISGDRTIELGYLLPIVPLFWMGHYYGDLDNSLISFDALYNPFNKFSFYGELLFDDETFSESWTKSYQNKWAYLLGVENTDFLSIEGLIFNFEYSRLEPYVYTHKFHINRYMNLDYYLGVPSGPDSEMMNFKLKYFFDFDKNITAGFTRSNLGEPVWGKWDQPNYAIKDKVFLRGTVEKNNYYYVDVKYSFNKYISMNLFYSHTDIANYNHNLPAFNEDWYEDYIAANSDGDPTNDYDDVEDYYSREVEPYKSDQLYSNNTFALKLNLVLKNYFKDIF